MFAVFDFDIVLPEVHRKGQLHAMLGRVLRQERQEGLFEMQRGHCALPEVRF